MSISTSPRWIASMTNGVPLNVAICTLPLRPVIWIAGMTNWDMLS